MTIKRIYRHCAQNTRYNVAWPTHNNISTTAQNVSLPEFHHEKARELQCQCQEDRRSPTHGDQVLCDPVGQPSRPRWWPPHNGRIKSPGGYQTEFTKDIAGQMSRWNEFIGREEMKINVPVLVSRCCKGEHQFSR